MSSVRSTSAEAAYVENRPSAARMAAGVVSACVGEIEVLCAGTPSRAIWTGRGERLDGHPCSSVQVWIQADARGQFGSSAIDRVRVLRGLSGCAGLGRLPIGWVPLTGRAGTRRPARQTVAIRSTPGR